MVTESHFFKALGAVSLLAACCQAAELPAYRLNDIADRDVITPVEISVTDAEATRVRRVEEAKRIPLHARYSTQTVHGVEASIHAEVAEVRGQFLDLLEVEYGMRRLQWHHTQTDRFQQLLQEFLAQHPVFPRPPELFNRWAMHADTDTYFEEWVGYLRQAMAGPVRARYPEGLSVGTNTVIRLVPVEDLESPVDAGWALTNFSQVRASIIRPLWSVRPEMRAKVTNRSSHLTSYFVGKIEVNCVADPDLTERVRELAVGGLLVADTYQVGEAIIKEGQKIDAGALAALAALREKLQVQTLALEVVTREAETRRIQDHALWLGGLLMGVTGVLVFVAVRLRMKKRRSLLPVLGSSMIHGTSDAEAAAEPTVVDAGPPGGEAWQKRALLAEERAEQARDLAKSRLMPHLAKQLKDNVVQELALHRDELMGAQEAVAEQMIELEERLQKIHGPLSERLAVYTQRIAELEAELAQRGEENKTLIRARIEALQQEMLKEARGGGQVS